jgi:predicted small metal-binding protein
MTKLLRCADVVPGCPAEVRADDDADLMRQVAEHARSAHGLEEIDPETARRVQAAIRAEP